MGLFSDYSKATEIAVGKLHMIIGSPQFLSINCSFIHRSLESVIYKLSKVTFPKLCTRRSLQ